MNTGDNIRFIRQKKGMTQKELAEKLGKTPQYISKIESSENPPKMKTLQSIADALDVQLIDVLFGYSEQREQKEYSLESLENLRDHLRFMALNRYYDKLNDLGRDKAIERVEELTEIKKYTDPNYTDPDDK